MTQFGQPTSRYAEERKEKTSERTPLTFYDHPRVARVPGLSHRQGSRNLMTQLAPRENMTRVQPRDVDGRSFGSICNCQASG